MVRVNLTWNQIAPSANSTHRPAGFNAINPGAYPAGGWAPYDAFVRTATADHITVDFTINGPAPLWATGSGAPKGTTGYFRADWEPSAKEYGFFVKAVGTRYSGSFKPAGSATALPRVSFGRSGTSRTTATTSRRRGPAHQSTPNSPHIYRNLLDAAWSSLNATGHSTRTDKILFGEVTPHGNNTFGVFANMKPLIFLRSLYCVDSNYHQLRGSAARAQGCPTTAAGSRSFRKQNPALFSASAFAAHPYEEASAPNRPTSPMRDQAVRRPRRSGLRRLPGAPRLERTLDRLNGIYGSHSHFPVWSTEFGFRTRPPDPHEGVSPSTAAIYMNQAEYLSYKQSRVFSYSQYALQDQAPPAYFDTGLINPNGSHKPGFDAYRMPLWLPSTSTRKGRKLEVWGGVRPAAYAKLDTGKAQSFSSSSRPGRRERGRRSPPCRSTTRAATSIRTSRSRAAARCGSRGPIRRVIRCSSGGTVTSRTQKITVK